MGKRNRLAELDLAQVFSAATQRFLAEIKRQEYVQAVPRQTICSCL